MAEDSRSLGRMETSATIDFQREIQVVRSCFACNFQDTTQLKVDSNSDCNHQWQAGRSPVTD